MSVDEPSDAVRLRRAVAGTTVAAAAVFAVHAGLFGVLIDPGASPGCTTGLYPGTYADLFTPVHLAMLGAIAALVAVLAAARSPRRRPGPRTVAGLVICGLAALAALADHDLVNLPAVVALIAVVPTAAVGAIAGTVHTLTTVRAGLPPAERWARHAALAQVALWTALVVGVPAALAAAYVNGAGLFCF